MTPMLGFFVLLLINDSVELGAALERLRRLLDARDVRIEGDDAHGQVLVDGLRQGRRDAARARSAGRSAQRVSCSRT